MNKKYVYLHHEGMEIFITEQELSKEECYCSYCDDYDTLIEVCDNEESFGELLTRLFAEGYDLVPCDDFNELIEKYGTDEKKKWYFEEQYYSVSKGPFWIVCSVKDYNIDFSNAELIAYPAPIETEPVPSHKNVWKEMKRRANRGIITPVAE